MDEGKKQQYETHVEKNKPMTKRNPKPNTTFCETHKILPRLDTNKRASPTAITVN